jgi:hypothetical protein
MKRAALLRPQLSPGGSYAALQNRKSQNTAGIRTAALGIDLAGDGLTTCQATKAEIMTASAALSILCAPALWPWHALVLLLAGQREGGQRVLQLLDILRQEVARPHEPIACQGPQERAGHSVRTASGSKVTAARIQAS